MGRSPYLYSVHRFMLVHTFQRCCYQSQKSLIIFSLSFFNTLNVVVHALHAPLLLSSGPNECDAAEIRWRVTIFPHLWPSKSLNVRPSDKRLHPVPSCSLGRSCSLSALAVHFSSSLNCFFLLWLTQRWCIWLKVLAGFARPSRGLVSDCCSEDSVSLMFVVVLLTCRTEENVRLLNQ